MGDDLRQLLLRAALVATIGTALACSPPEPDPGPEQQPPVDAGFVQQDPPDAGAPLPPPAPALGTGDHSPESVVFTQIATFSHGLRRPRDLAFNPSHPDELWVVSNDDDSTLIIFDASKDTRVHEKRIDAAASHFMEAPTSIAFGGATTTIGKPGTFATCQESRNTYNGQAAPNDFMGPALWSSDLSVYAVQNPAGLGSHLDMLHASPNCMGIAHVRDNVYWAFGGKKQSGSSFEERQEPMPALVKYDFGHDHGVGLDDHSDGQIFQYVENEVKPVPGIPSHMFFDLGSDLLYVADTGNSRVAALDTNSGTVGDDLLAQEPLVAYARVDGATLSDVVPASSGLLVHPSGIELHEGLIYVSDNSSGWISAFNLQGERVNYIDTGLGSGALAGIAFGPDGKLYFVDMKGNQVLRIDPK